jgi:hypothetical protein
MLPLLRLRSGNTGAFSEEELIKAAEKAAERRRASLTKGGEYRLPDRSPRANRRSSAVDKDNAAAMRLVEERQQRVKSELERTAAAEAAAERERAERAAEAVARLELRRAADALKAPSDTDEAEVTSESDADLSIDPDIDDERAEEEIDELDYNIDDPPGSFVSSLDAIFMHMEEALTEVNRAMEGVDDDTRLLLFGVATRLRADMRMLSALRRRLANTRTQLIRSPTAVRDVQQVDRLVREAADGPREPNALLSNWNRLLPLVGMLVYLLAMYVFPGTTIPYPAIPDEDLPVVHPYEYTPEVVLPYEPPILIPTVTRTDRKIGRARFHAAVAAVAEAAAAA